MPHFCPKCEKKWKCITDILYEEIIGKGECDLGKECICYKCSGISGMEKIKQLIVKEIKLKQNGVKSK